MSAGHRIRVAQPGGIDVLKLEAFDPGTPGEGEVLVRHHATGVNFIDTYHRSGLYPMPLPFTPGSEAAGVVEALGAGVSGLAVGDRVAWFSGGTGGYATHRAVPAGALVRLPDSIAFDIAAAAMLKGCTAAMLVEHVARVQAGDVVLVHAAAGGVGAILVQWLKAIGARVIAHAGSADKAARARALGADTALSCPMDELAAAVRAETDGRGVRVVLDGVGAASWTASLDATARRGHVVTYGNASGPVPPFAPLELARRGSLTVTRPTLFDFVSTPPEMQAIADRLFAMIASGAVSVDIGLTLPLAEAAEAHRRLEARETTGSVVLLP